MSLISLIRSLLNNTKLTPILSDIHISEIPETKNNLTVEIRSFCPNTGPDEPLLNPDVPDLSTTETSNE